jgi:hypothetical protein
MQNARPWAASQSNVDLVWEVMSDLESVDWFYRTWLPSSIPL